MEGYSVYVVTGKYPDVPIDLPTSGKHLIYGTEYIFNDQSGWKMDQNKRHRRR